MRLSHGLAMSRATDHTPTPRGESIAALVGAFLFVVMLYAASIGPVARLCRDGRVCRPVEPALRVVYAPIIICGDQGSPLRGPLLWYVEDVWGGR